MIINVLHRLCDLLRMIGANADLLIKPATGFKLTLLRRQQRPESGAGQRAAGCHHADAPGTAERDGRFQCGLDANQRQCGMLGVQLMNGGSRRRFASHHQRLDALAHRVPDDGAGTAQHMFRIALAVGAWPLSPM